MLFPRAVLCVGLFLCFSALLGYSQYTEPSKLVSHFRSPTGTMYSFAQDPYQICIAGPVYFWNDTFVIVEDDARSMCNLGNLRIRLVSRAAWRKLEAAARFQVRELPGLTWALHKRAKKAHHIGHWAPRLPALFSFGLLRPHYEVASVVPEHLMRVLMINTDLPLSDWEEKSLSVALFSKDVEIMEDRAFRKLALSQALKFEWLISSGLGEAYWFNTFEAFRFRSAAYQLLKMRPRSCFQRKVVVLVRDPQENARPLWNLDELLTAIENALAIKPTIEMPNSKWTMRQQANLFAEAPILLAVHSSQLTNVLFSPVGGVVIEISPYLFYNPVWKKAADFLGVNYIVHRDSFPTTDTSAGMLKMYANLTDSACSALEKCRKYFRSRGAVANVPSIMRTLLRTIQTVNFC